MEKRREFKVTPLHTHAIPYDPLVDHHLEYYFSSKNNRQVLLKTKVVNRKNQILDRSLAKMIEHGQLNISNKFRLKKSKPKRYNSRNDRSIEGKVYQLSSTVGKKQFEEFLQSRRNELKSKTMQMRVSLGTGKIKESEQEENKKEL